ASGEARCQRSGSRVLGMPVAPARAGGKRAGQPGEFVWLKCFRSIRLTSGGPDPTCEPRLDHDRPPTWRWLNPTTVHPSSADDADTVRPTSVRTRSGQTRRLEGPALTRSVLVTAYAGPSLDTERQTLAEIGVDLLVAHSGDEDEVTELARDVDAILTNWKPVSGRTLRNASRCLTVARYGVGVDNIDVATATDLGILVSNVPDYCIDEVSDHALALVLSLNRRIVEFAAQTRSGGWDNQGFGPLRRLRDQTLGLIGFGRISRRVAAKAQ